VAEQTKRDAELAAHKLNEYRKQVHTPADAASDGEDLAQIVIKAAEEGSVKLQETLQATLDNINAMTDAAVLTVHEAALASEKRIEEGLERALARLQETLKSTLDSPATRHGGFATVVSFCKANNRDVGNRRLDGGAYTPHSWRLVEAF